MSILSRSFYSPKDTVCTISLVIDKILYVSLKIQEVVTFHQFQMETEKGTK